MSAKKARLSRFEKANSIVGYIKLLDLISLAALVLSFLAIFLSIIQHFLVAAFFILGAMVLDQLDGRIARLMHRKDTFGRELDSLCDVVTYLIAVSLFAYFAGLRNVAAIVAYALFITAGILRLARFNLTGIIKGYYIGLPVFYNALIPFICLLFLYYKISLNWLLPIFLLSAYLMISRVKIKKIF